MSTVQTGALWRIASTRMPTKWGMFDAIGFERDISDGARKTETALALVMGDLTKGVPRIARSADGIDRGPRNSERLRSTGKSRNVPGVASFCKKPDGSSLE